MSFARCPFCSSVACHSGIEECDARRAELRAASIVGMFRAMTTTAIEAEQRRAEAEERTGPLDPGVAAMPVVEEES